MTKWLTKMYLTENQPFLELPVFFLLLSLPPQTTVNNKMSSNFMCSLVIKAISFMQISTLRWYSHHTVCRCELTPGHASKCIFYFVFIHSIQKSRTSECFWTKQCIKINKIKKGIENLYTLHELSLKVYIIHCELYPSHLTRCEFCKQEENK